MATCVPQVPVPDCNYVPDPNFPTECYVDWEQAYCCTISLLEDPLAFAYCLPEFDICFFGKADCKMTTPFENDDGQPMLKMALNSTSQSPWVKVAFQQYCLGNEDPDLTATTIITMGNKSQPGNKEICKAAIRDFQYGWGTVNQGNRCRITIVDEKGSGFEEWVERIARNPEADAVPVAGKNRMKVQFGWYISGGHDNDVCGQPVAPEATFENPLPPEGYNSAYVLCSPIMWFIPDWINVNYDNGKFIYNLEGVDTLARGQEFMVTKKYGNDNPLSGKMYFTKACELLGRHSTPPFRVQFKAKDETGQTIDMKFVKRPGDNEDKVAREDQVECQGWGPFDMWACDERPPLAVIHQWIISNRVSALDTTGKTVTNQGRIGITINYDPTFKFEVTDDPCSNCDSRLPQYGMLTLWANGIPATQDDFTDKEINDRMKAVYIVNGGDCLWYLSEILTEDGWNYIGNIYRKKYSGNIACVDENGNLAWEKINNWYRSPLNGRKLVKVHLHNSRQRANSISGAIFTDDHPVLTNKGYTKVKDLKISEHLIHSGTHCPSQEIQEAVIGMILGDGHIRRKSFSFNCTHCEKQKEYIEYKGSLLNLKTLNKPHKKYKQIKITSKALPYWRSLRKLFYPNGIKTINEKVLENFTIISLAFLYMDDGSINKKKLAQIATCCFTIEEVDLLIKKIKSLGIDCYRRKNSKYPRIHFNVKETTKLCKLIAPYIISSMDYKLITECRIEKKELLKTSQLPFYDNFDLIRCDNLENKTKYVYCIGVNKHQNFITHSGVVHNCSPVLQFNPAFRWHFLLGEKSAGTLYPTTGQANKATAAAVQNNARVTPTRGMTKDQTTANTGQALKTKDVGVNAQVVSQNQRAANLAIGAIEADLRVQGDPSAWLCSPIGGYGRCVGIVFINPYFLINGESLIECPVWAIEDAGDPAASVACNRMLTNRGWFVMGVDHQIRDGSYITTLKLKLLAPGSEITDATADGKITHLGGDPMGLALAFAGQHSNQDNYPVGAEAAGWCPTAPDERGCIQWVGTGSPDDGSPEDVGDFEGTPGDPVV